MTTKISREIFTGSVGNRLVADIFGGNGRPVLLLHGGGQTRHAWRKTAEVLSRAGWLACALDQRGHGDSDWIQDGSYEWAAFGEDAIIIADNLARRTGIQPVAIGASLGGKASMLALAAEEAKGRRIFSALVLVDVTPRVDRSGVKKIQMFMKAHAQHGFGSIEEAANAVTMYLPHRPRPRNNEGLRKNLRQGEDGRWRWHWDPRFIEGERSIDADDREVEAALVAAAQGIKIPTLLVRGASSELVHEDHVREFLTMVPHAEYADVSGAHHMIVGDRNDEFSEVILRFMEKRSSEQQCETIQLSSRSRSSPLG